MHYLAFIEVLNVLSIYVVQTFPFSIFSCRMSYLFLTIIDSIKFQINLF